MTLFSRRALLPAALALATLPLFAPLTRAADDVIVIGYQTTVDPAKVAQADGAYEKALGLKIEWKKFDSGADVITAIASGDVQIGYVGSSPLASAASRELPIETILIAAEIGDAEALVVRNGSGIKEPKDLVGKKIGVPFVSTTHYSLLAALKTWGIDPKTVNILNLRPPEIAAAFARGDLDGGYVWDPALGKLKENGSVLVSSAKVAEFGAPTFDAWIARKDLIAKNPKAVTAFVKVTGEAYAAYRANTAAYSATSQEAAKIAKLTGSKVEEVPELLKGNIFPTLTEQTSDRLLGGGTVTAVTATAGFLKEQGRIPSVLDNYAPYVSKRFASEALTQTSSR